MVWFLTIFSTSISPMEFTVKQFWSTECFSEQQKTNIKTQNFLNVVWQIRMTHPLQSQLRIIPDSYYYSYSPHDFLTPPLLLLTLYHPLRLLFYFSSFFLFAISIGISITLQWIHNGCDSVSNHQPYHCLLNGLFRRRSKKTSKLRVTGLCAGNSPVIGEFPAQMASNAENVSNWWHHHDQ